LSDHKIEVLRLLAAGKTNQQVAKELVVVLDTTKRQVTHTFGKLGAGNHTEAVARARGLKLVQYPR
jgi:LuxR family maltose regulon positive regulatory protein